MSESTCADCGAPLPPRRRKRCDPCRVEAERMRDRRRRGRVRAATIRPACIDCGTTGGMDWWVELGGSYLVKGQHDRRCEACFRELSRQKNARSRKRRRHTECIDCGDPLTGGQQKRCGVCGPKARRESRDRKRPKPRACPCGVVFWHANHKRTYCGDHCPAKVGYGPPPPGLMSIPTKGNRHRIPTAACPECGGPVVPPRTKWCSDDCCRANYSRQQVDRIMGLYRTAYETGRVKQAMHWRYELTAHLRERDGDNCGLCGERMRFDTSTGPRGDDPRGATIDHVVPRSLGGSDDLPNLQLAHWSCNNAKGNRCPEPEQLRLVG